MYSNETAYCFLCADFKQISEENRFPKNYKSPINSKLIQCLSMRYKHSRIFEYQEKFVLGKEGVPKKYTYNSTSSFQYLTFARVHLLGMPWIDISFWIFLLCSKEWNMWFATEGGTGVDIYEPTLVRFSLQSD